MSIGATRRIKSFVPIDMLEKVYKSLGQPYFKYCFPLWDNCGKLPKDKLLGFLLVPIMIFVALI